VLCAQSIEHAYRPDNYIISNPLTHAKNATIFIIDPTAENSVPAQSAGSSNINKPGLFRTRNASQYVC